MENELKDERGWYLPEVKAAVIAEIRRGGAWAAMERYGIPHATVAMWAGQERRRARVPIPLMSDARSGGGRTVILFEAGRAFRREPDA